MNNQEYWAKRSAEQMWGYMEEAEKVAEELTDLYMEASHEVQDAAKKIFETYKSKYSLSEEEAERLLKMMSDPTDLRAVLRKLEVDPKNTDLIKQIEGQAYGSRLARLSSVYSQIEEVLMLLYAEQQKRTKALLEELSRQAYYDKLFNLHQYSGYGFEFKTLSKKQIERVLNSRWYGANYSEKIWKNREDLARQVKKEIMLNLLTGRPLREAAKSIDARFAVGYGKARRLIRTESCYTCNQLQLLSMKEHGVERYIYVAILDLKTSETCRGLDKEDFSIEEAAVGKNCPPMHPWCRSTIIAYIPKELLTKMKQSAIDPVTGERIKVPGDMTHKEWYEKYVKGKEDEIGTVNTSRQNSYDKDQFERYKKVLHHHVPETFEKFKEMKYNDSETYGKLKHAYRIANQYENNSGNMDPMKIVELHDEAVRNKALFTGNARKKGNLGLMELDGNIHIASSQIGSMKDPGYVNFKGEKKLLVTSPEKKTFDTLTIGHDRVVDSEYKLFEHASKICNDGKPHKLELISEKAMCDSCKGVMKQFIKRHPNVEVNAVSHKGEKAEKIHNRNPVFEYDVKREYERNENG